MGLLKRSELEKLKRDIRDQRRINSAPGVLVSRTTRGNFVKPVKRTGSGGGQGFVPKWG